MSLCLCDIGCSLGSKTRNLIMDNIKVLDSSVDECVAIYNAMTYGGFATINDHK